MTLLLIASAILFTVFLWWFSTGAILWLERRPRRAWSWSLIVTTVLALAGIAGLCASRSLATPAGAVCAFACAIAVWGWHEASFLMGLVTGPRTTHCPPGASGWRRFTLATSTLIYHEVALVVTAASIVAITWGAPNQIGAWTFVVLLVARLSAKLNIFLGVPNFTDEFFPDHLRYLTSYLRKSPMNAMFPLSIAAGAALAAVQAWLAFDREASAFAVTGSSLIFALTALALLEHAFMVMPLPDAALWRWAVPASPKNTNLSP